MATSSNYVPQVDYTSRDYAAISADLQNLIPNFLPDWTNRDPADFGITLIELFAYMGDLMSYYIDRSANEAFLTTASQRQSVLQIANLLNYTPSGLIDATTTLEFTNSTTSAITVPAGTQVATTAVVNGTNPQVIFETQLDVVVPATSTTAVGTASSTSVVTLSAANTNISVGMTVAGTGVDSGTTVTAVNSDVSITLSESVTLSAVTLTFTSPSPTASVQSQEGQTITSDPIQVSDGLASQIYQLVQSPVIQNSVAVTVDNNIYTQVSNLLDSGPNDAVFAVTVDANNNSYVQFGDNISGRIPPINSLISFTYRIGVGASGNVAAGSLTKILNLNAAGLSVNQANPAIGGADIESTDSIRVNAQAPVSNSGRVVSLQDYATAVTGGVQNANKANAISSVYTAVTLYVAQKGDPGIDPLTSDYTTAFVTLSSSVQSFLEGKTAPNVTVSVLPPSYVPINVTLAIVAPKNVRNSTVQTAATAAIAGLLTFDATSFGETVKVDDIRNALYALNSQNTQVSSITFTTMARSGDSGYADVVCAPNEIPEAGTITVTVTGGISS